MSIAPEEFLSYINSVAERSLPLLNLVEML
jgi:hypothetical protein